MFKIVIDWAVFVIAAILLGFTLIGIIHDYTEIYKRWLIQHFANKKRKSEEKEME